MLDFRTGGAPKSAAHLRANNRQQKLGEGQLWHDRRAGSSHGELQSTPAVCTHVINFFGTRPVSPLSSGVPVFNGKGWKGVGYTAPGPSCPPGAINTRVSTAPRRPRLRETDEAARPAAAALITYERLTARDKDSAHRPSA